jgi:hypothetical protein
MPLRSVVAVCLAAGIAGCTPRHLIDFSEWPEPTPVTLACGETYNVYDFTPRKRLVVESKIVRELFRGMGEPCKDFEKLRSATERFAKIARQHLESAYPGCTLGAAEVLSAGEYRFAYSCEEKPSDPPSKAKARRAGP